MSINNDFVESTMHFRGLRLLSGINGGIEVDRVPVIGAQQPGIPDSTGSASSNQAAINAVLHALRQHGIIASA